MGKRLAKGLVQAYTSTTDFFNFAPFGLALRAAGHGFRSRILSFSSIPFPGPLKTLKEHLPPEIAIVKSLNGADISLERGYNVLIINGIHEGLDSNKITLSQLLRLINTKPAHLELVFSGSGLPPEILDKADLITEIHLSHQSNKKEATVEVITGEGKGKTTYCLGKALLASATGIKAAIVQMIKAPKHYGEVQAIERLPNIEIYSLGEGFIGRSGKGIGKKHVEAAQRAWEAWLRKLYSKKYGLLVLDEINIATHYGLVRPERVVEMLSQKPPGVELLLSGRYAHPDVMRAATTVIEMKEIKHPFRAGIKARKGIEF